MTYLFDLGHPAHFHLFKHTIIALKDKGHKVIITAKEQPVLLELLRHSGMEYISLGKKGKSLPSKALRQLVFDWKVWQIARKHHVDIGLGVTMSVPHAALFCKMKSVLFDDDDRAVTPLFYRFAHSVAGKVLSPDCLSFQQGGKKYTYYNGYHELAYLHPARFTPDPAILQKAGVNPGETYFILRFNAFGAYHDAGQGGFSDEQKQNLVDKLKPHGRVFITGEKDVAPQFRPYLVNIHPAEMHSFMAFATLYLGDSQTMASEAAVLGVPSLRMNSFVGKISYLEEQEKKYSLTYGFKPADFNKMLAKIDELLAMPGLKAEWQRRRQKMLEEKIDVTAYLVEELGAEGGGRRA
jgi:predicted glycosyltransferase